MGHQSTAVAKGSSGNKNSSKKCKYFASGNCRNGANCRFSHDDNSTKKATEVTPLNKGGRDSQSNKRQHGGPTSATTSEADQSSSSISLSRTSKKCSKCFELSATLNELKGQANLAQHCLSEMNLLMTTLQQFQVQYAEKHTVAQQTLDKMQIAMSRIAVFDADDKDHCQGSEEEREKENYPDKNNNAQGIASSKPKRVPSELSKDAGDNRKIDRPRGEIELNGKTKSDGEKKRKEATKSNDNKSHVKANANENAPPPPPSPSHWLEAATKGSNPPTE